MSNSTTNIFRLNKRNNSSYVNTKDSKQLIILYVVRNVKSHAADLHVKHHGIPIRPWK